MQDDTIRQFHAALPGIRQWIDEFLNNHAERARAVRTLGFTRFSACLFAYGVGLIQFGYAQSPLERLAYSLQEEFDSGMPLPDLVNVIEMRTDDIWTQVAQTLQVEGDAHGA